jgi:hypothetical protein
MMLRTGTPVQVLTMEAGLTEGRLLSATGTRLSLQTAAGESVLTAADVVRVDLVAASAVSQGLRGAATGAGAVGVLGLLAGRMPPARVFAAGAITGAYAAAQVQLLAPGPQTVYLVDRAIVPKPLDQVSGGRK